MARWTEEELEALRSSPDFGTFASKVGYSKSYDAWEVKRRRVSADPEMMSPLLLARAVANNVKLARQIIRLRHSIEADDELAVAIPRIRETLQGQAQEGRVTGLTYDELRTLLHGQ